jgi:hypothetical protein
MGITDLVDGWLLESASRLDGRFTIVRVNDWTLGDEHGITFHVEGRFVLASFSAWPQHLSSAGWRFADFEVLDIDSGARVAGEWFVPLSTDLLDRFLAELESIERARAGDTRPT